MIKKINNFCNAHRSIAFLCVALSLYFTLLGAYRLWSDTPSFNYLKVSTEQGINDIDSVMNIKKDMEFRKYIENEIMTDRHSEK